VASYTRGTTVTFSNTWVDTVGDPIVPFNSSYPQVVIYDPAGAIAASGIAIQSTTPGTWKWEWTVPGGATLGEGWKIGWTLLDLNKETFNYDLEFEVADQLQVQTALDRDASYITTCGGNERLIFKSLVQLEELDLIIRFNDTEWATFTKDQLTEVFAEGLWHYYRNSPTLADTGTYLVIWRGRETTVSPLDQSIQYLRVAPDQFWVNLPYLRGLLDKLGKVQDTPLSYTNSELYQYMERGLDFVNGVNPLTGLTVGTIPPPLVSWWILASGWWGLQARQLLEIDIEHEFGGQLVNLNYERSSKLGEIISRWQDLIREELAKTKKEMFIRSSSMGMVSVRPYRNTYNNRVYRTGVSNDPVATFPGILNRLGLSDY